MGDTCFHEFEKVTLPSADGGSYSAWLCLFCEEVGYAVPVDFARFLDEVQARDDQSASVGL